MGVRVWEMRMTWESGLPVESDINRDKWCNSRSSGFEANSDGKVRNIKG